MLVGPGCFYSRLLRLRNTARTMPAMISTMPIIMMTVPNMATGLLCTMPNEPPSMGTCTPLTSIVGPNMPPKELPKSLSMLLEMKVASAPDDGKRQAAYGDVDAN